MPYVARIDPGNERQTQVAFGRTFRKEDGWVKVTDDLAKKLPTVRMSPLSIHSPPVFEVKDQEAAKAIHAAETQQFNPPGTPDAPKELAPPMATREQREAEAKAKADAEAAERAAEAKLRIEAEAETKARAKIDAESKARAKAEAKALDAKTKDEPKAELKPEPQKG